MLEHHFASVTLAPPIETTSHEESPDYGLADGHILNMEEINALSENLRLVIALDAEALARMATPKAFLEYI
jgi:hypothetical protein